VCSLVNGHACNLSETKTKHAFFIAAGVSIIGGLVTIVTAIVVVIDIIPIIIAREIIIDCFEMTSFRGSLIFQQCGATIAVATQ